MTYKGADMADIARTSTQGIMAGEPPLRGVPALPSAKAPLNGEGIWYVVISNPQCDERAVASIERAGLAAWSPSWRQDVRRGRPAVWVTRTRRLFPRYVFAKLSADRPEFGLVRGCDGVEGFVDVRGNPLRVPTSELDRLELETLRGAFDDLRPAGPTPSGPLRSFDVGDRVEVVGGAMAGSTGTVEFDNGGRVAGVKLDGFEFSSKIRIRKDSLNLLRSITDITGRPHQET